MDCSGRDFLDLIFKRLLTMWEGSSLAASSISTRGVGERLLICLLRKNVRSSSLFLLLCELPGCDDAVLCDSQSNFLNPRITSRGNESFSSMGDSVELVVPLLSSSHSGSSYSSGSITSISASYNSSSSSISCTDGPLDLART